MNGYKIASDNIRDAYRQGMISKEDAEKQIRVYDFLADCDIQDLCCMIDSTAFNEIIKAYVSQALENTKASAKVKQATLMQLARLFDEHKASDIVKCPEEPTSTLIS